MESLQKKLCVRAWVGVSFPSTAFVDDVLFGGLVGNLHCASDASGNIVISLAPAFH